jgi:hypothetical protein
VFRGGRTQDQDSSGIDLLIGGIEELGSYCTNDRSTHALSTYSFENIEISMLYNKY